MRRVSAIQNFNLPLRSEELDSVKTNISPLSFTYMTVRTAALEYKDIA